jgi:hypothetical protein
LAKGGEDPFSGDPCARHIKEASMLANFPPFANGTFIGGQIRGLALLRAPKTSNHPRLVMLSTGYFPSKSSTSLAAEAEPVALKSALAACSVAITPPEEAE